MAPYSWINEHTRSLCRAVLKLKDVSEAERFFRDLLTLEEIREFSKRWQAVKLLAEGETYREVAKKTGLSTSTVVRVAHWLKNGMGGYRDMLTRMGVGAKK